METGRKRIRKDFAPLNVAVSVVCDTPTSPYTQVFNSENGQYEPDREVTPTVIRPEVIASASDGSWHDPHSNQYLADMVWYVNGKDITTLSDWQGLYSIDTVGSTRGSLTIMRNILPEEKVTLRFEGVIADNRLGVNIPVVTEEIILSTADKSKDTYSLSIGEDQIIRYDPFLDRLHLYEHKVAQGLISASNSARQEAMDENSYLRSIPVSLHKGNKILSEGYTVKLFRITGTKTLTQLYAGNDEIISISPTTISIDLRVVTKSDYLIIAYIDGETVSQIQFSVNRVYRKFTCKPTNGTSIAPGDSMRFDKAMVDSEGQVVECPGRVIKIVWKTDTAANKGVVHNEGERAYFEISKTGLGNTYTDNWLDTITEAELKPAYSFATDGYGNYYTDENGNKYIIN